MQENDIELNYVFLTHEHYDHINGLNALREMYSFKTIASKQCSLGIQDAKKNLSRYFNVLLSMRKVPYSMRIDEYVCKAADMTFDFYSFLEWNNHKLYFFWTPGHSRGSSVCILDNAWIFSGDTVLEGQPVFTKLPGGSLNDYKNVAISILRTINDSLIVYPGHGRRFFFKEWINAVE